ncbi:transmembrane amino acid transporter protein-domain-containing protein [Plectosphaerella plurivora]|uniref:Transmembrane amino acid transporter protein-domain-containing protein n=1 Tax=Plectosphaerella plurivora TaxID=936078 RepID=A0A9P9ACP1_9PEZI|nr:transmembrane amino acid transporter protein-domain-containing protein [Plectosphaerella plurivora]
MASEKYSSKSWAQHQQPSDPSAPPATSPLDDAAAAEVGHRAHDPVFGDMSDTRKGPNYRDVGWMGTAALMMKTQLGLGVLSIPSAFDKLGIVPGLICLIAVGTITTWSSYMIGIFKLNHREVYSLDDAGHLIFGRVGREVMGFAFCLLLIFVGGSGMLGISIGLNAISTHAVCTAVFVAVAAIAAFLLCSIRTLGKISWLAWVGLVAIVASVLTVTIAVAVQDRPAAAPQEGPWASDYKIIGTPTFAEAVSAVSIMIFSYAGTPTFFSIASEMRDPRMYTRSLMICQIGITVVYIIIGCVVYYFCGSYVASPALGSAGVVMKKVSYGLALPGLLVSTVLVLHLPAKFIFVRLLRNTHHLASNTLVHWSTWLSCTLSVTVIAYIIASAIPIFDGLVSLIGALLGTFLCFLPMGAMWFYDNWHSTERNLRWYLMAAWATFVIVIGLFLMGAGTWGSIDGIIQAYRVSNGSSAFSCADNSNST